MPFHTTEKLGPKQSLTPEGYLLCEAVPIARTGSQIYAAHELPWLEAGNDGLITVIREEREVFRPETLASFEGKSVTVRHTFVDPNNVKQVEVGHAQNLRRSEDEPDLLIADLLIKEARAIQLVQHDPANPNKDVWREVSCGYNTDYEQHEPGVAYQRNIIGNHVAIVERGRAGPRCSIQDSNEELTMSKAKKAPSEWVKRLLRAIKTGDQKTIASTADEIAEEEQKAADEEAEEAKRVADEEEANAKKETADTLANLVKTVDALTKVVATLTKDSDDEEKKTEDEDEEKKTEDDDEEKKETADAMRETVSRAEILVPGFVVPTADAATVTRDSVTTLRRKVLADAMKNTDVVAAVTPLLAGRTLDALTADAVDSVFVGASEMVKLKNNSRGQRNAAPTKDFGGAPKTPAEINRLNSEFWAKR